jgi:competence protein ComEC
MSSGGHGQRAPLLWLLLPFMAGLAAGDLVDFPVLPLLAGALVPAVAAVVLAWRGGASARWWWPPTLGLTVMLAGAAYFHWRLDRPAEWKDLPPREARLTIRVTQLFAPVAGRQRATGLAVIIDAGPPPRQLVGQRLYFSLNLPRNAAPPLRSSEIAGVGVIELLPRHPAGEGFAGYLASAGINFKFTRGRVLGEVKSPSRYQRFCHAAEQRFHAILGAGLADQPALAAILRAMMLGQKQEMSEEQQELFMHSGTMHLFAISGLNITVIALSAQILLALLRVPRLAGAAISLAALWLYVDITGASPSAVRAFVMSALFIAAFALRRPGSPLATLATSALLILLFEPMQLFGASFQMSYGIVAVLLLLGAPLTEALLTRWPLFAALPEAAWRWYQWLADQVWRGFLGLIGIGLAASLVSTVSTIQFFQLFTPASLAVNLVLIPLSTLVIGAGFLSLLCGLAGFLAGSVLFNHAGLLLIWLMDFLLRAAMAVPGVYGTARFRAPWMGPAILAAVLATCLAGSAWHWRRERGGFWPPFVLGALLLILGARFGG